MDSDLLRLDPDLRASFLEMKSALYDRNTGLYAYPYHFDDLQKMVEWKPLLGVVALGLHDLDRIEWACGWQILDRIQERLAAAIRAVAVSAVPPTALLAISGVHGGSFLLFLPEMPGGTAPGEGELEGLATRLATALTAELRRVIPSDVLPEAEVCAGSSLLRCEPVYRIERLIHRAIEEARGRAARVGSREEERSGAELRAIIRAGLVETHFQPILDLRSGEVFGYEALARGPRGTIFETPRAMFGYSDRMRIAPLLDTVCRRRALHAARGMESGKKLFLNALPATLSDPRFDREPTEELLAEGRVPPARVVLEITERTGVEDFESFGRRIDSLRQQGFQIAIDDVGTGYSSLQTISEVRPEFLKIDLSLVKNIHRSLVKQEIVSTILQIGERIGASVIAEGVETEEEFRAIRGFGVRLVQGFYFGAPGPAFPPAPHRLGQDV